MTGVPVEESTSGGGGTAGVDTAGGRAGLVGWALFFFFLGFFAAECSADGASSPAAGAAKSARAAPAAVDPHSVMIGPQASTAQGPSALHTCVLRVSFSPLVAFSTTLEVSSSSWEYR